MQCSQYCTVVGKRWRTGASCQCRLRAVAATGFNDAADPSKLRCCTCWLVAGGEARQIRREHNRQRVTDFVSGCIVTMERWRHGQHAARRQAHVKGWYPHAVTGRYCTRNAFGGFVRHEHITALRNNWLAALEVSSVQGGRHTGMQRDTPGSRGSVELVAVAPLVWTFMHAQLS